MANLNNILEYYINNKMLPVIQRSDGIYCLGGGLAPTNTEGNGLVALLSDNITNITISGTYDTSSFIWDNNNQKWSIGSSSIPFT